jgi:hypothetical protein
MNCSHDLLRVPVLLYQTDNGTTRAEVWVSAQMDKGFRGELV